MRTQLGIAFALCLVGLFGLLGPWVPAGQACDTWVALPDATRDGRTLWAKNSDRLVFDSGPLMFYPRRAWPDGAQLDLGRITVPQAAETYATLGSSPYWSWGYEEGINEFAVAIGNQGIYTKVLADQIARHAEGRGPALGLTGMDLVRLGLERGRSAREALEAITTMVETYGQFGSGLPTLDIAGAYDNSFIIADPAEAWVLETAGTKWIARRVSHGTASISNTLSIGTAWDASSPGIAEYAAAQGWWPPESLAVFDFAEAYGDQSATNRERKAGAETRARRSGDLLRQNAGQIDVAWMMRIARDRATSPSLDLDPTASSCVAVLPTIEGDTPVLWWCATRPSTGCYVPYFVHAKGLPAMVSAAGTQGKTVTAPERAERDQFSPDSYWWLARDLCDKINADWDVRSVIARAEFDRLEAAFAAGLGDVLVTACDLRLAGKTDQAAEVLTAYTARCFDQALAKTNELRERFSAAAVEVPDAFRPYTGTYVGNFGPFKDAEFKVSAQNGRLAVDIPGQAVVELKDPDEAGLRHLVLTDAVAVSFDLDSLGEATALWFRQTTEMPRKPDQSDAPPADSPAKVPEDVPEEFRPYLGTYSVPPGLIDLKVVATDGRLAVEVPGQGTVELGDPDQADRRTFVADPNASVIFLSDAEGRVTAIKLTQAFRLPRKTSSPQ
jgi:secernin